ncbi:hypothetical protein SAMN04489745_0392 [Arthrobacter woluwensis]|uniref:Uncharacterized protein n=1 Tax=Arthrobacter woluwensis TaxID=156980 RepID=A0A1H4JUZ9_9MICC|nr:hypothetical protein SAMN04489745_0392 [Arthrobacter woluwensis]
MHTVRKAVSINLRARLFTPNSRRAVTWLLARRAAECFTES